MQTSTLRKTLRQLGAGYERELDRRYAPEQQFVIHMVKDILAAYAKGMILKTLWKRSFVLGSIATLVWRIIETPWEHFEL